MAIIYSTTVGLSNSTCRNGTCSSVVVQHVTLVYIIIETFRFDYDYKYDFLASELVLLTMISSAILVANRMATRLNPGFNPGRGGTPILDQTGMIVVTFRG